MTPLHLGKRPATYDKRDLQYASVRPKGLTLPNLPATWGHGMDFGASGWLMLGNGPDDTVSPGFQGCGDCVFAGAAHETMQAAHEAKRSIPHFSGATVVQQYSAYSGYDPVSGNNDNGSIVRDVLLSRQQTGFLDDAGTAYKIGAFVTLELGNWRTLREACFLFESVGMGFQFPDSGFNQLNNGQDWSVVPGAQIVGGHYVPIVGHPWAGYWTCVTWGQRQVATWQFISTYADELWAFIDMERYNKVTGQTAEGWKDVDLEQYLVAVTKPGA
jgi:hypothetical protein